MQTDGVDRAVVLVGGLRTSASIGKMVTWGMSELYVVAGVTGDCRNERRK